MEDVHSIKGKRILFLAPSFFGYENKIKDKMEQLGAIVDFYDERSVTKAFDRALLKIVPSVFNKKTFGYYNEILKECKNNKYDYIFVIKCDMLTEEILEKFHVVFPNAIFCLYLYDSVKNIKGVNKKFKYFDRILSFDRQDTLKYPEMKFRSLFYIDDFKKELRTDNKYKYDISFCGTIHSDRFGIIREVTKICKKRKLSFYSFCYLQSKFIYYFYKVVKHEFQYAKKTNFSFVKASSREISDVVDESRVILDIQHPKQTGLTMRTIEMIGMNKKLITTNAEIKEYNFYNPNNILVIDRKNINIPEGFLSTKYVPIDTSIYDKYSITAWIEDILYAIE
ncbi:capsular biosynthesis protein CpsH [Clostridium sp. P21]|uniref:Capsular biosynthesis protein CpsH n=1 Tax=Clostridium muellerianum TaxID=2716538 RepID=A0A7Y0EKE4_9CLOT|nr:capsular biosynthesis protein CpsH [Clostridium muellerianum]NMM65096.1 capsular biosynthesis protein CpsH [Clostridium muellerianum]